MPQSKPRKKNKPRRPARSVDYMAPAMVVSSRVDEPAPHALAAEATGGTLGFVFRGHRFVLDLERVDFGRAMFAMKIAARGGDVTAQLDKMLDTFDSLLGSEQVTKLYDIAPDMFSSESAQREFWTAFTELTVGADLGEPSAS